MCIMRDSVRMYDVACDAAGQAVIDGTPEFVEKGVAFVSGEQKVGGYANSANIKRENNSRLKDVTVLCNTENKKNMRFLILVCNSRDGIEENGEILWDYGPSYKMMTHTVREAIREIEYLNELILAPYDENRVAEMILNHVDFEPPDEVQPPKKRRKKKTDLYVKPPDDSSTGWLLPSPYKAEQVEEIITSWFGRTDVKIHVVGATIVLVNSRWDIFIVCVACDGAAICVLIIG